MEYITLRQLAKILFDNKKKDENMNKVKSDYELSEKEKFDNYYSDICTKYKKIMDLVGMDYETYKNDKNYNIPIELKPFFIFFLSEITKNPILKNLTKQKRSQHKEYKSESERIGYILRPDYKGTKNEEIKNEFIKFIIDTDLIDEDEKYQYLLTLSVEKNDIYEITCMHLLENVVSKVRNLQEKISYSDNVNLINLKERIILVKEYSKKIDDLIEEIDIAKDILDAENQDIILGISEDRDIYEKVKYCVRESEKEMNDRKANIKNKQSVDEDKRREIREFLKL